MTDQGAPRPRRAFAPLPDEEDLGADASDAGSGGGPADVDPQTSTQTRILRRLAVSPSSPASPATQSSPPARSWAPANTPVPPPRPVLPEQSSGLPASAGRRFSASAEPAEVSGLAPRRSAASVSSPPSALPPPTGWVAAAPLAGSQPPNLSGALGTTSVASGVAASEVAGEAAEPSGRTKRGKGRAFGVIAGVVAIAGLVMGAVYWLNPQAMPNTPNPTPNVSSTPPVPLDPVLTTEDVTGLAGATWLATTTGTAGSPLCLPAAADGMTTPDRSASRVLASQMTTTDTITHVVDTYADAASASRAYSARVAQVGACDGTTALITASYQVSGLADAASAVSIDVQEDPVQHHTLLITQTGRNVSMIDLALGEDPPEPEALAAVAAKPLARLCSGGEGTCPTTLSVKDGLPPAGTSPGWLTELDMPRITLGYGRWKATDVFTSPTVTGSQCEIVDLVKVTGATVTQRTLLLADDPAEPPGFGVDQVNYKFADADAAKKYQGKLNDGLADCDPRVPTAKVANGPSTKGIGAGAVAFAGKSYMVTQQTSSNKNIPYRVAVLRVGNTVSYLLANPTADFDFTDAQWKALMLRAGQRVSQLP